MKHYAIIIRGIVYEIVGNDSSGYCVVSYEDWNNYADKKTFKWSLIVEHDQIVKNNDSIIKFALSFKKKNTGWRLVL